MDTALSMPRFQERLRVVAGSAALTPSYIAHITPLGSYALPVEALNLSLRRVLQSAVTGGVVDERAWAIARLPGSLGRPVAPAIVDYTDAAYTYTASYVNTTKRAALVHLFSKVQDEVADRRGRASSARHRGSSRARRRSPPSSTSLGQTTTGISSRVSCARSNSLRSWRCAVLHLGGGMAALAERRWVGG